MVIIPTSSPDGSMTGTASSRYLAASSATSCSDASTATLPGTSRISSLSGCSRGETRRSLSVACPRKTPAGSTTKTS